MGTCTLKTRITPKYSTSPPKSSQKCNNESVSSTEASLLKCLYVDLAMRNNSSTVLEQTSFLCYIAMPVSNK